MRRVAASATPADIASAKVLLKEVQAVLSHTPRHWLALTRTLPIELLDRKPAPGEWSAAECLHHLLDTESFVFPVRVKNFLAGQDFLAFNPDDEGSEYTKPVAELASEFNRLREISLSDLSKVSEADLDRTANHSELGIVTLGEMLSEWAAHDLMHTVQAEQALMQPFIALSGPWRVYFGDHDVDS